MENKEKMTIEMVDSTFARFQVGKLVKGIIVLIKDEGALINIGGKGDAFIYNEDLINKDSLQAGEEIDAIVIDRKDENGYIKLSQKRADEIIRSNDLVSKLVIGDKIQVLVTSITKSGLVAKLGDYVVFIPQSQVDYQYRNNLKVYANKNITCMVVDLDLINKKLVASIRAYVQKEKVDKENAFWSGIYEEKLVKGIVKRFVDFGAFVSINGKDCLVHNNDVGYLGEKAKDVFELNKEYEFVVLKTNREEGRISLGYKQLQEDPRIKKFEKYNEGDIVKGIVTKAMDYGAFIKFEENVEGLLHNSEAGYDIKHITQVCKVGDEVEVKIISIDKENFKLSLSINALNDYEIYNG